ncbi:low affinity iron transporter, putative [Tepidicaulis marinus]|uniref:Low affinity iron transporter, putative n=1 Tax=Tepidicaulis marinus TaxID=1333998 RepID=A0A081BF77_9HYPH|nr:hypothetical protein [Tepidicaulis marinus]GAK46695.1 low affinity iron transporter, putative [Tepidicaulis marinus]
MEYVLYAAAGLVGLVFAFGAIKGLHSTYLDVYKRLEGLRARPMMRAIFSLMLAPIWYCAMLIGGIALLPFLAVYYFFKGMVQRQRMTPEEERQYRAARNEIKEQKKAAAAARESTKTRKKKRGPIGGSHTAEIMMFGEDPVNRWAARKVRDKFF